MKRVHYLNEHLQPIWTEPSRYSTQKPSAQTTFECRFWEAVNSVVWHSALERPDGVGTIVIVRIDSGFVCLRRLTCSAGRILTLGKVELTYSG